MAQKFSARLENICYYYDGEVDFPVKVNVCFAVSGCKPKSLTFVAKYAQNITYRAQVKNYDSTHVYYTFRTAMNMSTTLDLALEDKNGIRSSTYTVTVLPTNKNVIKKSDQ